MGECFLGFKVSTLRKPHKRTSSNRYNHAKKREAVLAGVAALVLLCSGAESGNGAH